MYLTVREVAKRLGVSKRTVIDWIDAGEFPGARKSNPLKLTSPYEIPETAVADFERRRIEATK